MKYLFCVSSALAVDYGKYTYTERLHQVIDTIRSIKKFAPGSDIVLFDATFVKLPESDKDILYRLCDGVQDLQHNKIAKEDIASDDPKRLLPKSLGEVAIMHEMINYLENSTKEYDRVFKICGRYKLNVNFQRINYPILNGKLCMNQEVGWDRKIYPTRLWSFGTNILNEMKILTEDIHKKFNNGDGSFNIYEQLFHRCVNENNIPIQNVDIIGCEGYMFDGHFIRE